MKKFLKIFGFTSLGAVILAYAAFLFVLPNAIDLNQYKPEVQKIAEEQAKLKVNFENLKIITTPLLGVGVKADDISVKLPDDSVLFSASNFKTRISLPSLLLLTVKISCLEVNDPFVNLEIVDNKNFKISTLIEDILNAGKEEALENPPVEEEIAEETGFQFNPAWIRIKVPCVKLNNYRVLVNDLKSKHHLNLKGEELKIGYFNGKTAKIKTYAELFSDENKNITANVDINTFLPSFEPKLDEEDDPAEKIEIPFINPVTMYRNYDLKANLDTKIKVRESNNDINSYGYFNIDGLTLKISHLQLPESYLHAKTFGKNVDLDTNLFITDKDNINLLGKLKYGKKPKLDMNIKTSEVQFNNLIILAKALLDSLSIYNELNTIQATGSFNADCYIKTNFKKLKSNGKLIVKDGGINVKNIGKVINNANINLILEDNILDVKNSSLFVANSPITINGKIDEKSIADINIDAKKIPLPVLFKAFAPKELKNGFNFSSGDLTTNIKLKGKLENAEGIVNVDLDNLNIGDRSNSFVIKNQKLSSKFNATSKYLTGNINNNNFGINLPQTKSNISIPKLNVNITPENNIVIDENTINFNDKSNFKYSGLIEDYTKLKSITFNTNGQIATDDIIKLIGREFKPYIHSQGNIPVTLTINGNSKKQTLFVHALANKDNFITPVDIANVAGLNTSLQSIIDFKEGRIKIKKTGLFTRRVSTDEEGNEIVNLDEVLGVDGTIAGDTINLIKITMPKPIEGKIHVFPRSHFTVNGNSYVLGKTNAPRFRGGCNLTDLTIPELLLSLETANLDFKGDVADFNANNLLLNGSDISTNGTFSLVPASTFNISNLQVNSRYLNVDKLMVVADKSMKYVPQAPAGSSSNSQPADIPVLISNGSINMREIISGAIDIHNVTSRIALIRNIFYLRNMRARIFDGNIHGNIGVNLLNTKMKINVSGNNVNVDKMLVQAANMKETLSGTASFNSDISLQGATYEEQMRSLKGSVDFSVKDGQFGPFGKLENMILAENIRESQFFQTALGGIISGLLTIDTTHFSELEGALHFDDGICFIDRISSLGNILSLHIFGEFDLLRNYADMKVRARMASLISNLLGPIGAINPANLLNSAASLNVVTAKAFSIFCEMAPESEIALLPSFSNSYVDNAATKFQLVVRGDVAKPFTLVKSFKWLATANEYQNAIDYVNSLPEEIEGEQAGTIEEAIKQHEALEQEKKTLKYKLKHLFDKEGVNKGENNNTPNVQEESSQEETTVEE